MNKKFAVALSSGAVLALALTGCGDDNTEELDAWAKTVCGGIQPQVKKIEDASASIQEKTSDSAKPADVQKTDSEAFQAMSEAYKSMADTVDKAGAPPTDDESKTSQESAVKELNNQSKAYADLKKQVDALDTKDQAKFADGLKDIGEDLTKLGQNGNEALKKLQSGEVGEAMKKQPSCQKASSKAPSASANEKA